MGTLFPTYNRWNICVQSAEGATITDINGKQYLDFVSGIAVCNLGHRHPAVQKAIEAQLNQFWHVSNLFTIPLQEEVAQLLTANSCGDYVFFCNSGAEANEAALKLARKHTGRHKVITFQQSFHGRTFATMAATGQEKVHKGFGPLLPEFVHLPFNDVEALEKEMNEEVAAVLVEIVQGEGGVRPAEPLFLQKAAELCQQYGALFIVDEVQTGIGRTGKPFAYQYFNIEPDIITTAKGLGSGIPVGAMIGKAFLKDTFSAGVHGSTFGGNPIAMAAAKATLEIIFQPDFLQDVQEKGTYFLAKLQEALEELEFVKEVRGLGLLVGIECHGDIANLLPAIHEKGLLVLSAGPNVVRLLPPLIVTKEQLDQAVQIVKQTIQKAGVAAAK
ncbi:acetylornithine transaminase [Saccharococcus caldoxylosilyticus]|jgi:acetylornithine/N-succinyldiaminopimelate aminotransferase|uniref:Acetylornithine aminotransferase n=1 Tax=Parageobacillus caldoxylosilyticus NBRC 107762 TaxID=1220594 RepID=A0A023DJ14_9BACL|nr:acetylornithine transaminase [Parageobacillus caldoxylosilyticus]OQP04346.1 aspartate aminotransferase family protein [Geobacillus sp. 44B]MBB3852672.1 acetylornithine aminotransferase [Parageobacillus caldoxylosilyticus]QNU38107.1 acetylornithine transaminase [Geobacillus sp. 44B]BDG34787.1 acetylornithine aminotransferase [Parageobacillus caldoxylosilyticus]BDG38561.1 acetylornithine aminotransferase [Parageobacillus caldoxylosilyticus]